MFDGLSPKYCNLYVLCVYSCVSSCVCLCLPEYHIPKKTSCCRQSEASVYDWERLCVCASGRGSERV